MPRYDYRCAKGHRYETQEPFGSPSEHPCEKCGAVAKRQLSIPALAFKGSGFYVTDSRKSGSDSDGSSSSSSDSPSDNAPSSDNGSSSRDSASKSKTTKKAKKSKASKSDG